MSKGSSSKPTPRTDEEHAALVAWYKQQRELRLERIKNYFSIYVFILVVYGGALITEYLLVSLMAQLLSDDVARYPIVSAGFDYARIGLALLAIALSVVHGILAVVSQVRMEIELLQEGEDEK